MSWTVADVMTRDPIAVKRETPFKEIAEVLAEHRFGCVPVVDDKRRPLGVVTEEDLALKAEPRAAGPYPLESGAHRSERQKAAAEIAEQLMRPALRVVTPDASISEAARLLHREAQHALLVVDRYGCLAGIVTRADVLKVFLRADAELEGEIRREVDYLRQIFPKDEVTVQVRDGIVVLRGHTWVRSACDRLATFAMRVPGVVSVDNGLEYEVDDYLVELASIYR